MRFKRIIGRDAHVSISPLHLEDMPLFVHCTGGSPRVDPDTFLGQTIPVLEAHGVTVVEYVDRNLLQEDMEKIRKKRG